jgi:hypothetical protein
MRHAACAAALLLATVACTEKQQEPVQDLAHDQELVKAASAAANEVVRAAPDCEAARPLVEEAYRQIDDAAGRVEAAASRQILDTLRSQVDRVAQLCPATSAP